MLAWFKGSCQPCAGRSLRLPRTAVAGRLQLPVTSPFTSTACPCAADRSSPAHSLKMSVLGDTAAPALQHRVEKLREKGKSMEGSGETIQSCRK